MEQLDHEALRAWVEVTRQVQENHRGRHSEYRRPNASTTRTQGRTQPAPTRHRTRGRPAAGRRPTIVPWSALREQILQALGFCWWLLCSAFRWILELIKIGLRSASVWGSSLGGWGRVIWELLLPGLNLLIRAKVAGAVSVVALGSGAITYAVSMLSGVFPSGAANLNPLHLWNNRGGNSGSFQVPGQHNHALPPADYSTTGGVDYIVVTPTVPAVDSLLGPVVHHLGPVEGRLADVDDLLAQLQMQVPGTQNDIIGLLVNTKSFPSRRPSLFIAPLAWGWAWLSGWNPVSTRAASLEAIAQSAADDRASTASQLARFINATLGAPLETCRRQAADKSSSKIPSMSETLRKHDERVAKAEADTGSWLLPVKRLVGRSPLSGEVMVQLKEDRERIEREGRKRRIQRSQRIAACRALVLVEESLHHISRGCLSDQGALAELVSKSRQVGADAGRRMTWGTASAGAIQGWDKVIIGSGEVYLFTVQKNYKQK
ncbi:hypothetical protein QBC47DRAFT_407847 [Echria macrotheca]|uniref:Uncharacterized protein n=1 Tax=Echria macrotheca TaxID=438768 RepID=A0AAJ0F160_9PEZI|nr:hypothetical protein QBC47DRAFT_407847 [Echria macrotheca]